jgi:cyclopropane fatty-acyl-phospholipid synthase-like methyltransferase
MSAPKAWFEEWFDTDYYHSLYSKHDQAEAEAFIDHFLQTLNIQKGAKVLDLACGRGRHSIYLHERGFKVTGVDLSLKSIGIAKELEATGLRFYRGDMREFLGHEEYNLVVNLFTSFGYFETLSAHASVLDRIHSCLKRGGHFILDYLNTAHLNIDEEQHELSVDGIDFTFFKRRHQDKIVKRILVDDRDKILEFHEEIMAFSEAQLRELLVKAGFEIDGCFGSYDMDAYEADRSDRIIFYARKV